MSNSSSPSTSSPCLELTPKGEDPRELSEGTANLAAWAWPLSEDAFLRDIFRQQALCVHSGATKDNYRRGDRLIRESLGGLEAQRLFEATASEKVFIWVGDGDSQSHMTGLSSSNSKNGCSLRIHSRPGPPKGCLDASRDDLPAAPRPLQSVELEDPSAAAALHSAGHSAYCRAPPGVEQSLVGHLLAGTGLGCLSAAEAATQEGTASTESALARGEVEMFFGTAGHVTDWHFDFQENFTVQLSGSKRWLLARSPIAHPLRGHTPHYASSPDVVENQLLAGRFAAPNFAFAPPPHLRAATVLPDATTTTSAAAPKSKKGKKSAGTDHSSAAEKSSSSTSTSNDGVQVVVLHPGDVLYFPAGMWHRVATLEPGISLNVSLMGTPWADLAASAMRHALCHTPVARAALARGTTPLAGAASAANSSNSSSNGNDNSGSGSSSSSNNKSKSKVKLTYSVDKATEAEPSATGSKRKRGSGTVTNTSSSNTSNLDPRGAQARAAAAAVLAEMKRVTEALTVDDFLPLVLSHPEGGRKSCTEEGDDDDGDERGEGSEDGSHSSSNSSGEEGGQGPPRPPAVAVLTWQPPPGDAARHVTQALDEGSLRWNPLAELVRENECSEYYREMEALRQEQARAAVTKASGEVESKIRSNDNSSEDEVEEGVDGTNVENGDDDDGEVWAVHVNYGNDSLQPVLPKQRLLVPKRLQVQSLWELVRCQGGRLQAGSPSKEPEKRALLGALLYYGALSPA